MNVKIAAREAILEGNILARGKAGTIAIETANGLCGATQRVALRGNLVLAARGGQEEIRLRNVGAAANLTMELDARWNTFVGATDTRDRPWLIPYNDTMRAVRIALVNNLYFRIERPLVVSSPSDANHAITDAGNVHATEDPFVDLAHEKFTLRAPLAAPVTSEPPSIEPFRDGAGPAFRTRSGARDVGAFETTTATSALREGLPEAPRFAPVAPPKCSSCAAAPPDRSPSPTAIAAVIVAFFARLRGSPRLVRRFRRCVGHRG